jgi:signal transduction histidine kinase
MLHRQLKEPNQLAVSDKIRQSLKAMGELLDALLDIAKLDAGMLSADK